MIRAAVLLIALLLGYGPAQALDSLAAYERGLDRSCTRDSDCTVKNIGNCCGAFSACVNRAAQPDLERVSILCAKSNMASICGFADIDSCNCLNNVCTQQPIHEPQ